MNTRLLTYSPIFVAIPWVMTMSAMASEPVGSELIHVSDWSCTDRRGALPTFPGNVAESTMASDAGHNYVTWLSNDTPYQVMVMQYDGTSCSPAVKVNVGDPVPDEAGQYNTSHDAPSVFVDGQGYVYVTYFGYSIYYADRTIHQDAPYFRKSSYPNDITSWDPEQKLRLANMTELNGVRLRDGAVLMVGSDVRGHIDILEPGGAYRWPAMRQVITQDTSSTGDPATGAEGNRFTKAVFEQGRYTGRLYTVWGWACAEDAVTGDCDVYWNDSHEVFFAYSDDGGVTWRNKDNTTAVEAPLCPSTEVPPYCNDDPTKGILHDDPAFAITTTTRQREHRAIWEGRDGTIYVAFSQSMTNGAQPGALMMLAFTLGGPVTEYLVNENSHLRIGGIRKERSTIYIWAIDQTHNEAFEYTSSDGGYTWSRSLIIGDNCQRIHGSANIPGLQSVRMAIQCNPVPGESEVYYYRRTFPPVLDASAPALRRP